MSYTILALILIVLVLINSGMGMMHFSDEKAVEFFDENQFRGGLKKMEINNRSVKMVVEDEEDSDGTLLIFVHGAPGSWDAFKKYVVDKDIRERARVVSIDRPGYGGSGREAMPSIAEQADIVKEVINE